jgi:tRNA (cytidine/uridine-2'-O-)-methyltransferase
MFNIVLYQPEIPPNTGNIIRLCSNTGCKLHLIQPLGFQLDDKQLKRAGLDYLLHDPLAQYPSFDACLNNIHNHSKIYLCSSKAKTNYSQVVYQPGDSFVFGPETRGLPDSILSQFPESQKITIPMQPNSRSLNLSNAVAVIVYEAWRQQQFKC